MALSSSQPRGLHNFILDIRNSPSKESEILRVEQELQKIRQKFSTPGALNAYHRKKFVFKYSVFVIFLFKKVLLEIGLYLYAGIFS